MRWLIPFVAAVAAYAQPFAAAPAVVRQGDTVRVRGPAASARMNGRVIRLFAQPDGARLGLMPVPVDTAPGKHTIEFLAESGAALGTAAVTVRDARFPSQNVVIGKAVAELKPAPGEMETVAALRGMVSDSRYWAEPFAAPVPGCMNSRFGVKRLYNGKPSGNFHTGVDQRSPAGRPVRAIAAGVVRIVRPYNIHGNIVGIDHGQGLVSMYLHLSKFATTEGAVVAKGDVIGYVGSTGRSTGPHLHWGLYANGVAVNPLQWVGLTACAAGKPKR